MNRKRSNWESSLLKDAAVSKMVGSRLLPSCQQVVCEHASIIEQGIDDVCIGCGVVLNTLPPVKTLAGTAVISRTLEATAATAAVASETDRPPCRLTKEFSWMSDLTENGHISGVVASRIHYLYTQNAMLKPRTYSKYEYWTVCAYKAHKDENVDRSMRELSSISDCVHKQKRLHQLLKRIFPQCAPVRGHVLVERICSRLPLPHVTGYYISQLVRRMRTDSHPATLVGAAIKVYLQYHAVKHVYLTDIAHACGVSELSITREILRQSILQNIIEWMRRQKCEETTASPPLPIQPVQSRTNVLKEKIYKPRSFQSLFKHIVHRNFCNSHQLK